MRKEAMGLYVPPFHFEHGYVFDSANHMVADDGELTGAMNVKSAIAARIRGWGRIQYLKNPEQLQDEVGRMIADALNEYYARHDVSDDLHQARSSGQDRQDQGTAG